MKASRSYLAAGVAVLLLAALAWQLLWPAPLTVDIAPATRRTLTVVVEEQGRTRARDAFVVAAPVTGRLLRSTLEAGMTVGEGEVIASIAVAPDDARTTAIARADLQSAEARQAAAAAVFSEAESARARALRELERREELAKSGVSTSEEVDFYRQAADAAEARLESARAGLELAAAEVARAQSLLLGSEPGDGAGVLAITAPVSGTVYRVYEESERVVQAGMPLYSISRDDALEIIVDVPTQDAVQVRAGQAMVITGWGGTDTLRGEVLRVEPEAFTKISALGVEEQRVNIVGSLEDVPPELGAEYRMDVSIVIWEGSEVLTLPASAVFQQEGAWHAFVVSAGRARLRSFGAGRRNGEFVEVVDGITEGEQVVLFPSDLVRDGVRIAGPGE